MTDVVDIPFNEAATKAHAAMRFAGATIHQKFTCAKCGARKTMEEANKFYTQGKCEDCGHTTNLLVTGCGYLAIFGGTPTEGRPIKAGSDGAEP